MLDKTTIEQWIMPLLNDISWGERQRRSPAMVDVLYAIIYRLKTGCQWRHLPMQECSPEHGICWQTAYYHFRRFAEYGVWQVLWTSLLALHKQHLCTTIIQLGLFNLMAVIPSQNAEENVQDINAVKKHGQRT